MGEDLNQKQIVFITTASKSHAQYAQEICSIIEKTAKDRGTGIAKRTPKYIRNKIYEGKAIIALGSENQLAGFCYIETWDHGRYVANSGLVVTPEFRGTGVGKEIKRAAFELSRKKYPQAKIFGITTSPAVLKINSQLGYRPVSFAELTADEEFWNGCQSCSNYDILIRTNRKYCLCTGMLFDPEENLAKESLQDLARTHYQAQLGNDVF